MALEARRRTARPRTTAQLAAAYPLTIVIPTRDSAVSLRQCLGALLLNDLTETEILIVDDASEESLAEHVLPLAASTPLRWLRLEKRMGPAGARNRGLREAAFPHVLFVDSDIVLPARSLEWIREGLDIYSHRHEVAGVLGVYHEEIPWGDFFSNYKNLYTCHLYRTTDKLSPFVQTAIFCVRREVLESVGGFDGRLATAEDFRLGIDLGARGYRFVIDPRISGVHLKRYTLAGILREDRRRVEDLRQVQLNHEERLFYYRAHRWSRILTLALPVPILILAAAAAWTTDFIPAALLLLFLFCGLNLSFLNRCRRRRGFWFACRAGGFLFFEMLWASACAAYAFLRRRRLPTQPRQSAAG